MRHMQCGPPLIKTWPIEMWQAVQIMLNEYARNKNQPKKGTQLVRLLRELNYYWILIWSRNKISNSNENKKIKKISTNKKKPETQTKTSDSTTESVMIQYLYISCQCRIMNGNFLFLKALLLAIAQPIRKANLDVQQFGTEWIWHHLDVVVFFWGGRVFVFSFCFVFFFKWSIEKMLRTPPKIITNRLSFGKNSVWLS